MGFAVIGGMLGATVLAIFLIPACFYLVEKWGGKKQAPPHPAVPVPEPHA
jgi:HAE1 family hydrophobic/amphiphilic exporter-1